MTSQIQSQKASSMAKSIGFWTVPFALFLFLFSSPAWPWIEQKTNVPLSDGKRVVIKEKGFSLTPPSGWELHRNAPGFTLLLQTPYQKGGGVQRTIQVMGFKGVRYIDDVTARIFENLLVTKFSNTSSSIKGYRVRNSEKIELENKSSAILFYADYLLDNIPLMQVCILVSSAKRHFLVIYTDLAKNIEDVNNPLFAEAWKSLRSIELDSAPPDRFQVPTKLLTIAIGLVGIFLLLAITRYSFATVKYRSHSRHLESDVVSKEAWMAEERSEEGHNWTLSQKEKSSKSDQTREKDPFDDDLAV